MATDGIMSAERACAPRQGPSDSTSSPSTPQKRKHRHTQSLGLLSPIASFSSIASELSALVPPSPSPRTPRLNYHPTPATPPPRPTALRLLHPFSPLASPQLQLALDLDIDMPSSGPSLTATPPTPPTMLSPLPRPPSRSERLLKDTLLRDQTASSSKVPLSPKRPQLPHSPTSPATPSSSSGTRTHRRRHSHVPQSQSQSSTQQDLARGALLFRSAMTNAPSSPAGFGASPGTYPTPRSPAPVPVKRGYYGGDAEYGLPASPRMSHRGASPVSRRGESPMARRPESPMARRPESPMSRRGTSPRVRPSSPPRSASPSPSAGRARRRHSVQSRPDVLLRHEPLTRRTGSGVAVGDTPHTQVLKARLERVLMSAGGVVPREYREEVEEGKGKEREGKRRSTPNEVRDESGDWAWRDRQTPLVSTPPRSTPSSSSSSHSQSASQSYSSYPHQHITLTAPPRPKSHTRARSTTAPGPLPSTPSRSTFGTPSPRRARTSPAQIPISLPPQQERVYTPRTGLTPPLSGSRSTSSRDDNDEEGEGEETDGRLLTPPPTPPAEGEYIPSPYKKRTHLEPRFPPNHPSHPGTLHRPSFNARTASAHCRQIEGYVSFASVEGLGAPPEPEVDGEGEGEGGRGRRGGRGGGLLGWDWRKWVGAGGGGGVVV